MGIRATALAIALIAPSLAWGATRVKDTRGEQNKPAPAAKPLPVGSQPQQTTATFGDWVLRCARASVGGTLRNVCEVAEILRVKGQQAPFAQLAIGRPIAGTNKPGAMLATVLLPVNVSFEAPARLGLSADDPGALALAWRRCLPAGCLASAALPGAKLDAFRAAAQPLRLSFNDGAERAIAIPISTRGLTQALDSYAKKKDR